MPFLFLIVGAVMIVSAVRGTNADLFALLKGDFTGKGNFLYWFLSILLIGAVGYIPDLKPISRAFLALVIIVLFLKNEGVFQNFMQAVGTTTAYKPPAASASTSSLPGSSAPSTTAPSTGNPSGGQINNAPVFA